MPFSALLLASALAADPTSGLATPVKVIVNASNPVASLDKATVSRMFLKKQPRWHSGQAVRPVEPADPRLQEAFARAFHGRSRKEVDHYWRELIFSAREVPPEVKAKEAAVAAAVAKDPAAVGYAAQEPSDPGVKVVVITP
jgi:ABC-type phosphate transport system substrate-binding protein